MCSFRFLKKYAYLKGLVWTFRSELSWGPGAHPKNHAPSAERALVQGPLGSSMGVHARVHAGQAEFPGQVVAARRAPQAWTVPGQFHFGVPGMCGVVRTQEGSTRRQHHGCPCTPCKPAGPSGIAALRGAATSRRAFRFLGRRCGTSPPEEAPCSRSSDLWRSSRLPSDRNRAPKSSAHACAQGAERGGHGPASEHAQMEIFAGSRCAVGGASASNLDQVCVPGASRPLLAASCAKRAWFFH